MRNKLDKLLNRFVSKKLTVFLLATGFLAFGMIPPADWLTLSVVYIGSQAAVDAVVALKSN